MHRTDQLVYGCVSSHLGTYDCLALWIQHATLHHFIQYTHLCTVNIHSSTYIDRPNNKQHTFWSAYAGFIDVRYSVRSRAGVYYERTNVCRNCGVNLEKLSARCLLCPSCLLHHQTPPFDCHLLLQHVTFTVYSVHSVIFYVL